MNDDLIQRLRGLSLCQHSDFSIGNEAADEIERLREELEFQRQSHDQAQQLLLEQGAELAARDLVIEQMRDALIDATDTIEALSGRDNSCDPDIDVSEYMDVISTHPSTDTLKARDQNRDAELLRAAAKKFYTVNLIKIFEDLATKRHSGEWEPELEIKS